MAIPRGYASAMDEATHGTISIPMYNGHGEDLPFHPGPLPAGLDCLPGEQRINARVGPHLRRQDTRGEVGHCHGVQGQATGDTHISSEIPQQPEVPGAQPRVH